MATWLYKAASALKVARNGKMVNQLRSLNGGLIGCIYLQGAKRGKKRKRGKAGMFVDRRGKMVKNGKSSWAIYWRTNWRYKPARGAKIGKMLKW